MPDAHKSANAAATSAASDAWAAGDAFGGDGFHGRRCQRPARAAQGGFFLRALRRGAGSAARGGLGVEKARRPRCSARAVRVAPRRPGIVAAAGRRAQAPASGMTAPQQKKNNFFFAGGWRKRVRRELRVRALLWALPILRRAPLWVGSLLGTLAWYLVPRQRRLAQKHLAMAFPEKT